MIGSLGLENIALRGTQVCDMVWCDVWHGDVYHVDNVYTWYQLENTEYVYGAAVYTGQDTKMSMNSKLGTNKFSTVEHSMNKVDIEISMSLVFP